MGRTLWLNMLNVLFSLSSVQASVCNFLCFRKRASMYNLMVQAPSATLRSSNIPFRNFLKIVQGPPFLSTPQIILDQLNVFIHVKALHVYQLLHELPAPSTLQAPCETLFLLLSLIFSYCSECFELTTIASPDFRPCQSFEAVHCQASGNSL